MLNYQKKTDGEENQEFGYRIPVLKKPQDLKIMQFEAKERTIKSGENVKLSWKVAGADSICLNPGNIPLKPAGMRSVCVKKTTVYTLCARKNEQTETKEFIIYTEEDFGSKL